MAARRRQNNSPTAALSKESTATSKDEGRSSSTRKEIQRKELDQKIAAKNKSVSTDFHLAPLPLIIVVMLCSGALWVLAFRDVFATGRSIAGPMDDAMLFFTKMTDFFDDSKGWKSKQGGLSAIESVTTDKNNMGGFFVRKLCGAAAMAVHSQKLIPLIFQPNEAHWAYGHFVPMLLSSVMGNLAITGFYACYADELKGAGADELSLITCALLTIEALIMLGYALISWRSAPKNVPATVPVTVKSPSSIISRILTRTVSIISGVIATIAIRDLFFPGQVLSPIPRDDIYLEWTNSFIHSPPSGSVEEEENGLEAPLYIGDKFISQLMALYMVIFCFQKFVTAYLIRVGKDGSGGIKCRIFWRSQVFGNAIITFIFRLFAPAASSASLDLRWHLMCLAYETFIIGSYAFL